MADMMKVKDAATLWGLTPRRVSELCKQGKITNARKVGKAWMIPVGTPKPADQRIRSGAYAKVVLQENLPLPIGISDYRLASTEYYYIDKTMLIKDFLDERPMVSLFTRPRRFGKTLNMDMLRTFFEKSDEDTSVYFKNKKIWACGQKYRDYQGKYPVIFVSFKDVKCETWQDTYGNIYKLLQKEFERHLELLESPALNEYDKQKIKDFLDGKADENDCMAAFATLSEMLDKHYGIAPIIIVDEYDTPIQQGYMRGFYDSVIRFMRNLFSGGLKDNKHLSYGFLTGILRVAKESIFSGLNNLTINSVLDNKYSSYFGFTPEEVREMATYYGVVDKYDEIRKSNALLRIGSVGLGRQGERIYSIKGQGITLSSQGGGIGGKTGMYLVNDTVRKLTPRECARLQGFPDSFKIPVSDTQAYKQFGNSVVVPLITDVAGLIVKKLRKLDRSNKTN